MLRNFVQLLSLETIFDVLTISANEVWFSCLLCKCLIITASCSKTSQVCSLSFRLVSFRVTGCQALQMAA